jgi:hypothetical protein
MVTLSPYITVTRARAGRLFAIYVSPCVTLGEMRASGWLCDGIVKVALLFNSQSGEVAA